MTTYFVLIREWANRYTNDYACLFVVQSIRLTSTNVFVGDWRKPSQNHEATIRPRTNTLSKASGEYSSVDEDEYHIKNMRQVFVHGWIPTHNHGASIRTVAECPLISYCGRIPCQERGAGIRPWMNSTFSTNGFPECSSNLFVFVRGVKSCCRCTGCPDVMLLWCRCELLEREASV